MIKNEKDGLIIFEYRHLSRQTDINHFVSTRVNKLDKDFNLSFFNIKDTDEIRKNRKLFSKAVNIPLDNFVFQRQVHSCNVQLITKKDQGKGAFEYSDAIWDNDAMMTKEKNICLTVMAGDCIPLTFYDPLNKVIAVAHAGWRGTYKKIAEETIQRMHAEFGCNVSDILVGIGPSISQKNYEVDEKVYVEFDTRFENLSQYFITQSKAGKYNLDLWEANRQQLISAGIPSGNIEMANICTYGENDLFFSARRGDHGRFIGGIMMT